MDIKYEVISENNACCIKDLCNELMTYQQSIAYMNKEFFDNMSFETRVLPALVSA